MTQDFAFELKQLNEQGQFVGLAAVFGNRDAGNDVLLPGSFKKTIQERGSRVPLLWSHRIDEPIGLGEVSETATGLVIRGTLDLDVRAG